MADLIELDLVVKQKGLKESISATERLERQITRAAKAVEQNRISQDRYNKVLLIAKREYQALGVSSQKATSQVRRFADAQRAAAAETQKTTAAIGNATAAQKRFENTSRKGMRNLEVVAQQAGFQFGDLAVQIQGGTNAAVALGQQGSQLLGFFGAGGALAGAALAIGTAFIAPLLNAKKEAQGLNTSLNDVFKTLQENQTSLKTLIETSLVGPLEDARQKAIAVLEAFKTIDLRETKKAVSRDIQPILQGIEKISEAAKDVAESDGILGFGGRSQGERTAAAQIAKEIDTLFLSIAKASQGPADQLPKNLVEAFYALEQSGLATDDLLKSFKDLLEESGAMAAYTKEIRDAQEEAAQKAKERKDSEEEFINLAISNRDKEAKAAEKITETEKLRRKLAEDRLRSERKVEDFLDKVREQRRKGLVAEAAATEARRLQNVQKSADEEFAIRFAKEAELFDKKVEVSDDLLKVIETNAEEAAKRIAKKFEDQDFFFRVRFADETELMQQSLTPAKQKGPEKVRKQVLTDIQDTIDALREQTKHETKLLNLTGERLKEEEIYYDLVLKNKDADIKLSDKKLRAIAKEIAAQQEANEMYEEAIQFVDGISDAFSDFVATGLRDFKSFVSSIKDMFVRLLADMAAAAVRNRILIPITTGFMASAGNAAAGTAMGQYAAGGAQAGTFAATLATGAKAFGTGFGSVFGAGGIGLGGSFQALGSLGSSIGSGTFMSTLGAAAPALLAVVAVVGLLTKKTKLLDSGLRATVEGFDVAIETFKLTQTSRLFGLLKGSKVTSYEAADAELADPLIEAIGDMQQSIVDAAGTLGIGANAFDDFSYQFKLSLKGLTEEEQLQKINEEITKMGDSFASLSGHFETMNELLAAATQRYDLETRVLQLLGNETELLIRQRERERAATHELNRGMLDQVYALEDAYSAVNSAFATVQRSIEARKNAITNSFNEIMETIQGRVEAAQAAVGVSGGILSSLEGASGTSGMTRGAGLAYLRSLRGASRISDQKKLDDALQAIAEPSEGLYTNFVDYQRDFADQRNLIAELEEKARYQLSTDEQTLLEIQNEAQAAQARYDGQIEKLDEQLDAAQEQLNALYGIETSVKDVNQAIAELSAAVLAAVNAQAAAKAALRGAGTGAGTGAGAGVQAANAAGQQILNQLGQSGIAERASDGAKFQKVDIRGSAQLLQVAADLGVKTSGKTGAQIQQAISNAGNLGVNMDNATRALQFAMGGNFGGGLRMVGERGPELEATGPSRIFSTKQTAELFRNPELVAEVRSLREEVAGLRSESRQLQASNSKYVKRNYDINRKWDTEGLPATRT